VPGAGNQLTVHLLLVGVGMRGMNGSSRYVEGLLSGLGAVAGIRSVSERVERVSWRGRQVERLLVGSRALLGIPSVRAGSGAAVLHSVESVSVPVRRTVPIVVTAHDVCALIRPDWVSPKLHALKRLTWRRRHTWDAVVVPSVATRDDVMSLGIPEERIAVIRHGMAPVFASAPSAASLAWVEAHLGTRPFVLTAGVPSRKKGSDILLKAWARIERDMPEARLVWAGWWPRPSDRLPGRVVPLGQVADSHLAALYRRACAVVAPSRYEGYSLCVAEALAAGTPVIASDIPAHREFGSKAVHLFRSEDHDELAQRLLAGLEGSLARERVPFPRWEECARAHVEVYTRVAFV